MKRGFVLPTVLFGLLLLAAVVTGAYVAAFQSVRSSRQAGAETRTRAAAAGAIAEVFAPWNAARYDSLRAGAVDSLVDADLEISAVTEVSRTGENDFVVISLARDSLSGAERALSAFAKLRSLVPVPASVVRLQTEPDPALAARIEGVDLAPPGWICPQLAASITTLTVQSTVSDSVFWGFTPSWIWADLVSWVSSLGSGGDSLPWRFRSGDLVLSGERYTGVLLVDGNLIMRGGSSVTGILIVRGRISLEWPGSAIIGRVVAREMRLADGVDPTSIRIAHSSCAVRLAGRSRAPALPLPGVPWADRF